VVQTAPISRVAPRQTFGRPGGNMAATFSAQRTTGASSEGIAGSAASSDAPTQAAEDTGRRAWRHVDSCRMDD